MLIDESPRRKTGLDVIDRLEASRLRPILSGPYLSETKLPSNVGTSQCHKSHITRGHGSERCGTPLPTSLISQSLHQGWARDSALPDLISFVRLTQPSDGNPFSSNLCIINLEARQRPQKHDTLHENPLELGGTGRDQVAVVGGR